MNQKKIVLTGTHHTPAIEVIKNLKLDKKISWKIYYFSHLTPADSHLSKTIIPHLDITFCHIPCGKFDRRFPVKTIVQFPLIIVGFFKSLYHLFKIKPNIVVSFGGYVSVPTVIASWLLSVPSITHEQTLTISLATKINSFFVNKVALSFAETKNIGQLPVGKINVTGNILRREIFQNKTLFFQHLLPSHLKQFPLIYVTGGSQGAQFINRLITKSLPKLKNYTIIHQTGITNLSEVKSATAHISHPRYLPVDYVNLSDIGWVLNHSSIVISRAGANTCQELATLGLKSILIPYPHAQQNEQLLNAQWLFTQLPQSTIILAQSKTTPSKLIATIKLLLSRPKTTVKSIPLVTHPLIKLIHELA